MWLIGADARNWLPLPFMSAAKQTVYFRDLGTMPYRQAWDLQESLLQENLELKKAAAGLQAVPATRHHLLFVEHPPVYTLGKSGKEEHILISAAEREREGIEYYPTNRGGDITYHGPGQIVGYPILDLEKFRTDIGYYLRNLEEVMIRVLAEYGLKGDRSPGETGVWLDPDRKGHERKICAMGVRCSRWITMHGFAFNVNTPLHYFDRIIPCGIQDKAVTSLEKELGAPLPFETVKAQVKQKFEEVFDVELAD